MLFLAFFETLQIKSPGLQYFDIILFALIAVFLVLRLRNSLGRRNGEEKQGPTDVFGRRSHEDDSKGATNGAPQPTDNVYRLPDADKVVGKDDATVAVDSSAFSVLQQIQKADPDFTQQDFLNGARMAFEMIVEYFAKGDKDGLNPLLSAEVYKNFAAAIDARAERESARKPRWSESKVPPFTMPALRAAPPISRSNLCPRKYQLFSIMKVM